MLEDEEKQRFKNIPKTNVQTEKVWGTGERAEILTIRWKTGTSDFGRIENRETAQPRRVEKANGILEVRFRTDGFLRCWELSPPGHRYVSPSQIRLDFNQTGDILKSIRIRPGVRSSDHFSVVILSVVSSSGDRAMPFSEDMTPIFPRR